MPEKDVGLQDTPEAHFKAALSGGWPFSVSVSCCMGRDSSSAHCLLEVRCGANDFCHAHATCGQLQACPFPGLPPFPQSPQLGSDSLNTPMNFCRPGSITDLDDLVPAGAQLGTPAFLTGSCEDTSTSHHYWFVVVRHSPAQPHVDNLPAVVGSETSMRSTRLQADPHWRLPAKGMPGNLLQALLR